MRAVAKRDRSIGGMQFLERESFPCCALRMSPNSTPTIVYTFCCLFLKHTPQTANLRVPMSRLMRYDSRGRTNVIDAQRPIFMRISLVIDAYILNSHACVVSYTRACGHVYIYMCACGVCARARGCACMLVEICICACAA